jgi:hypothetical protein
MTREEFIKAMKFLSTAYDKEFNQEQVEVWYKFFVNEDYELLKVAIKNIVSKNKYMPSIAEIKEEMALLQTKDIPKAEDEWEEVLKAIHRYGIYRQDEALESLKPYTAYITRHIGFRNICMAEDQTWNKKEFIGEYNELKDKEIENLQIGNEERVFLIDNLKMIEGE